MGSLEGRSRWSRLGDGVAEGAGNKVRLLDRCRASRLSVPAAVVVPAETFEAARICGLVETAVDGRHRAVDANALCAWLGLPGLSGRLAIRSAFSAEDQ